LSPTVVLNDDSTPAMSNADYIVGPFFFKWHGRSRHTRHDRSGWIDLARGKRTVKGLHSIHQRRLAFRSGKSR